LYYFGDQIKEIDLGVTCGTYGGGRGEDKCIEDFVVKSINGKLLGRT
jgi:hypothetical protein